MHPRDDFGCTSTGTGNFPMGRGFLGWICNLYFKIILFCYWFLLDVINWPVSRAGLLCTAPAPSSCTKIGISPPLSGAAPATIHSALRIYDGEKNCNLCGRIGHKDEYFAIVDIFRACVEKRQRGVYKNRFYSGSKLIKYMVCSTV